MNCAPLNLGNIEARVVALCNTVQHHPNTKFHEYDTVKGVPHKSQNRERVRRLMHLDYCM